MMHSKVLPLAGWAVCPRLGALQWSREMVTWPGSRLGELFRFWSWNARRGPLLHWAGIQASLRAAMSSAMELPAPATVWTD